MIWNGLSHCPYNFQNLFDGWSVGRMSKAGYNGSDLELEFTLAEYDTLTKEQTAALKSLSDIGL